MCERKKKKNACLAKEKKKHRKKKVTVTHALQLALYRLQYSQGKLFFYFTSMNSSTGETGLFFILFGK
jgi:hypothetical protein